MEKLAKKLPFLQQRWFQFLRFLVKHFFEDNCQQKAASLTYTTMLSIVPVLTVLLMILSSIPALDSAKAQIYNVIYSNLLPQSSVQVSQYINTFAEKSSNLTIIGALVLFLTTIITLTTIERAFNQIWRVEGRSGGIKSLLRYWTLVTLGPLVLGTAFIASSAVQSLSFLNRQIAGYGIDWSFWVQLVSMSITVAGFIGMYWFIPKARVPPKSAAIAGLIVAIVFELMKHLFGTVIANFTSYEAIYGAFAALPVFLLWIYLSWNLILLGVEISYTLTIFDTEEVKPRHPFFSLLDMLNLAYTHHLEGEAVSEKALRNVLGRHELPKWYTYINYLQDSNLITMTDDNDYVLKKDLSTMSLWGFYSTLPYPLPTKDKLDNMKAEAQEPWLNFLIDRFENTESYAEQQLNLPLDTIFATAEPRKETLHEDEKSSIFGSDSSTATPSEKNNSNSESTPYVDPDAYDNHNKSVISTLSNAPADTNKSKRGYKRAVITEADNPKKSNK
ncbi:YhjD/YihY/BrkB family envelope integrity protein [Psychrobacter sp.]|uniref:YhjD/YihY/BrkB family envelope integrity protein n=1 Tax=Psychrobacter sp. TaxID=56811 RepID=UPI003F9C4911